ncbi:hypothetical protein LINGRAHAP2_LOCUS17829 [Linum grandiflorum]
MATASIHSPSPSLQDPAAMLSSSPQPFSPSSDKHYWSTLRGRIDSILQKRHRELYNHDDASVDTRQDIGGESMKKKIDAKRRKDDALLLLRGFDSISHTLSSLSDNIDHALQGARTLAEPPTLTELLQGKINSFETKQDDKSQQGRNDDEEGGKTGLKRKLDAVESDTRSIDEQPNNNNSNKLTKAKNLAVSMAKKAAEMARELKSMKSDMCFVQERCSLLEEENGRLRDGFSSGIRPEEDDLMRLQMEALLAEKSRLANENANLKREKQCLHQLVEYHQLTSQDLSASYEELVRGMGLDFSSSPDCSPEKQQNVDDYDEHGAKRKSILDLSTSLDKYFEEEQ